VFLSRRHIAEAGRARMLDTQICEPPLAEARAFVAGGMGEQVFARRLRLPTETVFYVGLRDGGCARRSELLAGPGSARATRGMLPAHASGGHFRGR